MSTHSYTLHTYASMRTDRTGAGFRLLKLLVATAPETFTDAAMWLCLSDASGASSPLIMDELSGLLVRRTAGGGVRCVCVMRNTNVDRIYTLPAYRGQGHAKKTLAYLAMLSLIGGWTFISPVEASVMPLFASCGWKVRTDVGLAKDGTQEMVSNPRYETPGGTMNIGPWVAQTENERVEVVPF